MYGCEVQRGETRELSREGKVWREEDRKGVQEEFIQSHETAYKYIIAIFNIPISPTEKNMGRMGKWGKTYRA